MGCSRKFQLGKQVRKQQGCIDFPAQKMDELREEISRIKNSVLLKDAA